MIEQIMDLVWWAVAASPLLMGNMGGGGGGGAPQQQATPPTLDLAQTSGLTQTQLNLLRDNIGPLSDAYGAANRSQESVNRFFGLRSLTDPGEDLGRAMEDEITPRIAEAQRELAQLERLKPTTDKRTGERGYVVGRGKNRQFVSEADYNARRAGIEANIERYNADLNRARTYDPVTELTDTFSDQYAMRDRFMGDMEGAIGSTSEYDRFQTALGQGLEAQTVAQRQADLSRMESAGMGQVADVRADQVGAGALGQSLMNRALQRAQSQGQLSPEASRDAVQAARSSMAARGLATGGAGMAAELLNRDRYSRARMAEDLAFAQGVQGQDLERQFANVGNVLRANLANQGTQLTREQVLSANRQGANLANMQAANQMAQYNAGLGASIDQFNAGQRDANNRYNLGLLGQSAALSDAERTRRLALQQDMYNFAMGTDPRMMLAGLGSPYANMTSPAASNMTALAATTQPIYSGGSFSPQRMPMMPGYNTLGAIAGGVVGGVGGYMVGGPAGAAVGFGAGSSIGGNIQ